MAPLGYLALMTAIFVETAGIPAPGESSLIAASILAAAGKLNIVLVVLGAATAAIAGDNAGYLLGRRFGRRLIGRPGGRWRRHRHAVLRRGERFFSRHGSKAVFLGRWLPFARVTSAWMAGASRMQWGTFAIWNALGGVAWAVSVGGVAYGLGASGARTLAIAAAVAAAFAGVLLLLAARRRGSPLSPAPPPVACHH